MLYSKGSIWEFKDLKAIPVNGSINSKGNAIMGKGLALQAAQRFPNLPGLLGQRLKLYGLRVHYFLELDIIAVPTKYEWWEPSSLILIELSCRQLSEVTPTDRECAVVPFGCGLGKLP